jgi:hypothetical protein
MTVLTILLPDPSVLSVDERNALRERRADRYRAEMGTTADVAVDILPAEDA